MMCIKARLNQARKCFICVVVELAGVFLLVLYCYVTT